MIKEILSKYGIDLANIKRLIRNERKLSLLKKLVIYINFNVKNYFFSPAKIRLMKFIYKSYDRKNLMINIGGGAFFKKHWRILDFQSAHYRFLSCYIDYNFDLTSGNPFPFKDNSIKIFYSSHTFEHIPQEYCQYIFNEIYRCLKIGGVVRITVPDFDLAYEAYGKKNEFFLKKIPGNNLKEKFLDFFATYLKNTITTEDLEQNFKTMKKEKFADYYTKQIPRASQKIFGGNHINWWNYGKTETMLKKACFENVYLSAPQKSRFPQLRGKGKSYGFDTTNPELSFFIEAIK